MSDTEPLLGVMRQAVIGPDADLRAHMRVWHGTASDTPTTDEYHAYLHAIQSEADHRHG